MIIEDELMSLKATVKNDLWRINYVVPFIKKYQFSEKGAFDTAKKVLHAYKTIKPIKSINQRTVGADTNALLEQVDISINNESQFIYFIDTKKTIAVPGNILSNFTLAYDKVIHGSFDDLVANAKGFDTYGKETKLVGKGIHSLTNRIIEQLTISNHQNKETLIKYFSRMLSEPAIHFDEALQRILFFNQIMWQTRHRLNGLGRLDYILNDLYERDIKTNVLTEDLAHNLVYDFLNNLSLYSDYKSDALEGDIGQIVILGGLEPKGGYFSNALTTIFLREQAKLDKPDPKTLLRVSKEMPKDILDAAIECLTAKTGSPLFSNDDVVIPSLLEFGIAKEDAFNYCVSACWEPLVVGKSLAQNNIAVFDFFVALDEVLEEKSDSYDELVDKYIRRNQQNFKSFLNDLNSLKWAEDPLVSLFSDGCSEKRIDVSKCGCKYSNYGITTVGLSNVIDSLMILRSIVFEQKEYSLQDLNKIRKDNYKKNSDLYNFIRSSSRHYGHDDEEVIDLVNKMTDSISLVATAYRNPFGGTVKFGLSSPGYNILSKKTDADISGRLKGMPYNTHISCVDSGYTELVNFAGKLNYNKQRFNGNVVDFFVNPFLIKDNLDKFSLFMEGAIRAGFFQMQMNILDSKTLIDAKVHPEKYKGLIVRVWGFSAYFNELPESYKDLLIERAKAAEKVGI